MEDAMQKIIEILIIALSLLISINLAGAQQTAQFPRVGVLGKGTFAGLQARIKILQEGLNGSGYVEAQNISFEYRFADGQGERLPALAAELVELDVDVIVALGCPSANAAKEATNTIPIVISSANPVMTGLVSSFARPGGNVTGMTIMTGSEFYSKRLELLKQIAPSATVVAILWNPDIDSHQLALEGLRNTAAGFDLELLPLDAKEPDDLDRAYATMKREKPGGLLNFGDTLFSAHRKQIANFAIENKLPTNFTHSGFVKAGALMSYGPNPTSLYVRLGNYVGKVLNGVKPADLPIEQPVTFDLDINLKTAEKIGLVIPPEVLLQATNVIK